VARESHPSSEERRLLTVTQCRQRRVDPAGNSEEVLEQMKRRPKWWLSLASVATVATLVIAATGNAAAPNSRAQSPSESAAPPAGTPYPSPIAQPPAPAAGVTQYPDPAYGTVTCGTDGAAGSFNGLPYAGNLKLMKATADGKGVEFDFCNPNGEFLQQIAFQVLGIDDASYLIANMGTAPGTGKLITTPNGTGPYKFVSWDPGQRIDFTAFDGYWGAQPATKNFELQWNDQSAARLLSLQSGTVDGIDNVGTGDIQTVQNDSSLKFYPRPGLNVSYLGMNNTDKPWNNLDVRQAIAQAVDRQKIVDSYYPPNSEVAKYFTPCGIPDACEGDDYWAYDPTAAKAQFDKGMAAEGIDPSTFSTTLSFRAAVRGYNPDPPTIAQEIANELQTNLGITVNLDLQDSGTFLDNNAKGNLPGLFLLGWGVDYPDASDFLDYHFGLGAGVKFGDPFPDLQQAVVKGDQGATDADRTAAYKDANNLIKKYAPAVIIAHGASGAAFKADVQNAAAAPLVEYFNAMKASGDTLTYVGNAEPLSLYCGDETDGETLRACNQVKESLYAYGNKDTNTSDNVGVDPIPALATSCTDNADATVWTCQLRQGVKFHDGSDFGADDVILSFAAQWDALSPLHVGRAGDFEYWNSLIGQGTLNPAGPCGLSNTAPCQ